MINVNALVPNYKPLPSFKKATKIVSIIHVKIYPLKVKGGIVLNERIFKMKKENISFSCKPLSL